MNTELLIKAIDEWIEENGPNGVAKLAIGADVSTSIINKIRTGYLPRPYVIKRLREFLKNSSSEKAS